MKRKIKFFIFNKYINKYLYFYLVVWVILLLHHHYYFIHHCITSHNAIQNYVFRFSFRILKIQMSNKYTKRQISYTSHWRTICVVAPVIYYVKEISFVLSYSSCFQFIFSPLDFFLVVISAIAWSKPWLLQKFYSRVVNLLSIVFHTIKPSTFWTSSCIAT